MKNILEGLFDSNEKQIKKIQKIVEKINTQIRVFQIIGSRVTTASTEVVTPIT